MTLLITIVAFVVALGCLCLIVLAYLLFGVIGLPQSRLDETGGAGNSALQFLGVLWIVAMFLFRNAYFMWFELRPRGATPGKRLAGIRVAARDGGQLTADAVIARSRALDVPIYAVSVVSPIDDPRSGLYLGRSRMTAAAAGSALLERDPGFRRPSPGRGRERAPRAVDRTPAA